MDDEIRVFAEGRPQAGTYGEEARERARERLLGEAVRGRRGFRLPRLSLQVAAAFGVTVALVGGVAVALTGGEEGAGRTASASMEEPTPGPGQFVRKETMRMFAFGTADGRRGLERNKETKWLPADPYGSVLTLAEDRRILPWPGESKPPEMAAWEKETKRWSAGCGYPGFPAIPSSDPEALRGVLYQDAGADRDGNAWNRAEWLLRGYLPESGQRALFHAMRAIPGVAEAQGVADAQGRTGVGLGKVVDGTLLQYIFDPQTQRYLGLRGTAADPEGSRAPKDAVLLLTAELGVTVVDTLPTPDSPDGFPTMDCGGPKDATGDPDASPSEQARPDAEQDPRPSAPADAPAQDPRPTASVTQPDPDPAQPDPDPSRRDPAQSDPAQSDSAPSRPDSAQPDPEPTAGADRPVEAPEVSAVPDARAGRSAGEPEVAEPRE
ncbi:hypothetical protein [Nonomuraea longicatena]|uniref:CU044_5270 family protein n=1 Tax=Nonomuraea longicatena TaxID=83682 RepID=A0ABN1PKJ9_9ACTN